ncbi:MAG: tetratricopeptide repeat protein, partial [Myxococcota bacterium]
MHRLTLGRSLMLVAVALTTAACGPKRQQVPDPPRVETIRLQIAKVRNAISETRETIANSRGATYLPELYVRLAELLSEEARYHYRLAYEREQRSSKVLHVPQVRLLKEKSIEIYELVLARFSDTELAPRALFNIGHEHRELGNFEEMRAAYQRLVDEYKDSPLRYDALLVLGDNYFDSNKLELSKGYYEQIAAGPLVKVTGLGHYKLAWVWVNQGDCTKALDQFETAIKRSQKFEDRQRARALVEAERQAEESAENPSEVEGLTSKPNTTPVAGTQQEIDVRRESLVDLSYCYSRERKWKRVLTYLQDLSYDRDTYVASLGRMASRYRTMDNYPAAILVTRELLTLASTDEDRLDDARTLYTAVKRQKDFSRIDKDTELIVNALVRAYSRIDFTGEERAAILEEFEGMVRDLATTSQEAMNKIKSAPRKVRQANKLSSTYRMYFHTFSKPEAKADMLLNMTEVLDVAGYPMLAGQRSLEASVFLADETERKNALYDSIVFFQESLSKEFDRTQYQRVTARAALRRAADQLLSYELEPDKLRRVKYAVAQTYYDEGRFNEAIDKLSAVAYEFPGTEQGDAAIQLVLDSYNTVNDNDGLMQAARRFMLDGSPATDGLKAKI